jgi:flagellar hook-length control protein FliK
MPSLEQAAGADAPGDGAPTFSEVLSVSAPDLPNPSATPAPSPAPPGPDATQGQVDTAATTVPGPPPPHGASSAGRRGHRQADPSGSREHRDRGATASDAPATVGSGASAASVAPSSRSTPAPPETGGSGSEEVAAGAAALVPATAPAPADPGTPSVVATGQAGAAGTEVAPPLVATTPDGPVHPNDAANDAASNDAAAGDTHSDGVPSTDAAPATAPQGAGDGSDQNGIGGNPIPTVRTSETTASTASTPASADVRISVDRAAPPGWSALHVGSEAVEVTGSSSFAPASVPSPAGAGTVGTAAAPASTDEATGLAEFPDGAAGTSASRLDISDLASSISRPLAAGNGDYSVQVSLHPPELGEVRALLSLQGDVLHVTLTPEHASGFEALSDAMPALHEQLAGGGVEVNVTLGQPGEAPGEEGRGPADRGPTPQIASDDATSTLTPSVFSANAAGPGRIHLVL